MVSLHCFCALSSLLIISFSVFAANDAEEVWRAEQEQADVVNVDAGWPAERWDCIHPP